MEENWYFWTSGEKISERMCAIAEGEKRRKGSETAKDERGESLSLSSLIEKTLEGGVNATCLLGSKEVSSGSIGVAKMISAEEMGSEVVGAVWLVKGIGSTVAVAIMVSVSAFVLILWIVGRPSEDRGSAGNRIYEA